MSSFNFQNNSNSSYGSPNSLITNAANAFFSGPSQAINTNNNMMNQYSPNNQSNFNNQNFGQGVGTGIGANNISNNSQATSYQSNATAVKSYSPMPPILKKGFHDFKPMRSKNPKLDEKHLVKCITMTHQNNGYNRNELRFKFVNMIPVKMSSFNNQQNNQQVSSNSQLAPSNNTQPVATSSFGFGNFPKSNQSFTLGASPTLGTSPTLNTSSNFFNQNKADAGNNSFSFGNNNNTIGGNANLNLGNNSFLGGKTSGMNFQINSNQLTNNSNSQFNFGNKGFNNGFNNAPNNNSINYNSFSFNNNNNSNNNNNNNGFNIGSNLTQPNYNVPQNQTPNQNFNFSSPNFPQSYNTFPSMNNQRVPLPNTGLFAPPDHNTISVFPYNTNLLALTLINSLLNQNPNSQQNQLQSSTNQDPAVLLLDQLFGNVLYEAVVVNSLVNSDYFKSLTEDKKVLLENAIRDKVRGKKPQKQNKLFELSGESQSFYNKKIQKQERSPFEGFMSQKQRPIYYRAPFLYQESSYEFNEPPIVKKSKYSRGPNFFDDQFEIKKIRSSENRPRRFYTNAPESKNEYVVGKTVLDQFQQNYNVFQKIVQRQITVKAHELPINEEEFVILPSMENFKEMTLEQLKQVDNVMISNQFGRVQFKEPISMYQKNLSSCIKIEQDLIQIIDKEWMNKRCDLTYTNFSGYLQADDQERKRLRKKIYKWASRNFMHNCHIQETTGDVTVQISS